MIAPAWPMRRPGGAVCPAMNATTGFWKLPAIQQAASSSADAADLADQDDRLGPRVVLERREAVDEVRPVDGIAADPDHGRLAEAEPRQLIDGLVRQRSRARDDADVPGGGCAPA